MLAASSFSSTTGGLLPGRLRSYPSRHAEMGPAQAATRSRRRAAAAENDFDVLFRGRRVGRIWRYDYTGKVSGEMARWLWHWDWRDVEGRKDAEGHCGSLEVAMAQFREAWDAPGGNVISTRR